MLNREDKGDVNGRHGQAARGELPGKLAGPAADQGPRCQVPPRRYR
jgi:hypothetical protein